MGKPDSSGHHWREHKAFSCSLPKDKDWWGPLSVGNTGFRFGAAKETIGKDFDLKCVDAILNIIKTLSPGFGNKGLVCTS